MANIKQQRKRVKIARRERLENLKYKSRIKTMFKSLAVAAQEDKDKAVQLGLSLTSVIDKAASRGVIHANKAARKKSQVAALIELPEGTGRPTGAQSQAKEGQKSKAEKAAERKEAKKSEKAQARVKQQTKAAAEAETKAAAKAKAQAEEAAKAAEAPEEPAAAAEEAAGEPEESQE